MENISCEKSSLVWSKLETVMDPEIPVISVVDLGIITNVECRADHAKITMTPTFTGCPAIDHMKNEIKTAVQTITDFESVEVVVDFTVVWSSDRISEKGKKALHEFGLAPPKEHGGCVTQELIADVNCPNCGSDDTTLKTPFGPTLCRAIHLCFNCKEGFESFKPV